MKEPPDKYQDYYKCVKVPLKHVVKHYDINQHTINDLVIKAHKIVIHTLQLTIHQNQNLHALKWANHVEFKLT